MARRKPSYYIRIDTYWQGSPNRFVGPYNSREEAEQAIKRGLATSDKVCHRDFLCGDMRNSIRVNEVLTYTKACAKGMKYEYEYGWTNILPHIPLSTDELSDMERCMIWGLG